MERSLLSKRQGPFFDHWENTPKEEKDKIVREKLAEYVQFAVDTTPFYRQRLEKFNGAGEHPLANVSPLDPSDLRKGLPPFGEGLLATASDYYTVFQSGGTTGVPKTSLFSHQELEELNLPNARGFFALGLSSEDRVANLFAVGGLYMTFVHINRMLQQFGCMNFPFSNQTPYDFVNTVTKKFHINTFTGITSVVLNCLREMHELDRDLQVEKIFYGGEHIYEADKLEMQKKLGVKQIAAPGYGTVDTWYLGYQCSDCPTGVFHTHDDQVYIEMVDEEKNQHCAPEEIGMMYATTYSRRITPIVRYRVGDRAKWLAEPCICGRTTPLFQLLGRGDDVLRIGYDSIDYNAIQDLVLTIEGLSGTIQMEKSRLDGKDLLTIRIESEEPSSKHGGLSKDFEEALLLDRPSFRDFIKKGTIHPLAIEILPTKSLPLNPRTGKLIRVIDAI